MDRLRKAARAAGFVMAGIEHETADYMAQSAAATDASRSIPLLAPPQRLLLAPPVKRSSATPTLWAWIGTFGRGAPA